VSLRVACSSCVQCATDIVLMSGFKVILKTIAETVLCLMVLKS
jgi:hypothetical protein